MLSYKNTFNSANKDAPSTVKSPATAMARLLMAPSTSPISIALAVPVAKGLALGTASHAIGTAKAMEMGEVEGAMSKPLCHRLLDPE